MMHMLLSLKSLTATVHRTQCAQQLNFSPLIIMINTLPNNSNTTPHCTTSYISITLHMTSPYSITNTSTSNLLINQHRPKQTRTNTPCNHVMTVIGKKKIIMSCSAMLPDTTKFTRIVISHTTCLYLF